MEIKKKKEISPKGGFPFFFFSIYLIFPDMSINNNEKTKEKRKKFLEKMFFLVLKIKFWSFSFCSKREKKLRTSLFYLATEDTYNPTFIEQSIDLLLKSCSNNFLLFHNQLMLEKSRFLNNLFYEIKANPEFEDYLIISIESYDVVEQSKNFKCFIENLISIIFSVVNSCNTKKILIYIPHIENVLIFKDLKKTIKNLLLQSGKIKQRLIARYNNQKGKFIFTEKTNSFLEEKLEENVRKVEFRLYQALFFLSNILKNRLFKSIRIVCSFDNERIKRKFSKFNSLKMEKILLKQKKIPFINFKLDPKDEDLYL